jgi:hypothetical protein
MKTLLVLSVVCACAFGASEKFARSPFFASPILASTAPLVAMIPQPSLTKIGGVAPASTIHAKHAKEVLASRAFFYSLPANEPHLISSYSLAALAPAPLISAYSLPTVSLHVNDQTQSDVFVHYSFRTGLTFNL